MNFYDLQDIHEEIAYWELVRELLDEQNALERQITSLRQQVNRLHMQLHYAREGHMRTDVPYPEPASDIVRDFSGFPAMRKLEHAGLIDS